MNEKKLGELIEAVHKQSDPNYTCPDGAFLELLQQQAKKKQIKHLLNIVQYIVKNFLLTGVLSKHEFLGY